MIEVFPDRVFFEEDKWKFEYKEKIYDLPKENYPHYKVGEVVAVAQRYSDIFAADKILYRSIPAVDGYKKELACEQKGWNNKMFVCANLMPHQIRIANIRAERLQDISDEDCLREGVVKIERKIAQNHPQSVVSYYPCQYMKECADKVGWGITYDTPKEAFAVLIEKVSGKSAWEHNPYVWVYEFELVK